MPNIDSERPIRFELPLHIARDALVLSAECCAQLSQWCGGSDQKQVTLTDESGNRYPCLLHLAERHLYGIGTWCRQAKPGAGDKIVLETTPEQVVAGVFQIKLSRSSGRPEPLAPVLGASPVSLPVDPDVLYLGQKLKLEYFDKTPQPEAFVLRARDLATHAFICGAIGSGKTVLTKIMLEEAALHGIPSIVIDLKGDLSSMALVFPGLRAAEFEPWVTVDRGAERATVAASKADEYRQGLARFGLTPSHVAQFQSQVEVNVFTPRSKRGIPIAFSPFVEELSANPRALMERDDEEFKNMLRAMTTQFVKRLAVRGQNRINRAKAYIYDIAKHALEQGQSLHGEDGLRRLIDLILSPPITHVGARPVDEYMPTRERAALADQVNVFLSAASEMWFSGMPFNVDDLIETQSIGRTPINVINISELDYEDQSYVISCVTFSIYVWQKRKGDATHPRLIFCIDEIGAGAAPRAFYPSYPANQTSITWFGINLLIRQGRAFGVGSLLATQAPIDIDCRGLAQIQTRATGMLLRQQEIDRIADGYHSAADSFSKYKNFIPTFATAEFLAKTVDGAIQGFHARWPYSYHKVLSPDEVRRIKELYESRAQTVFAAASQVQDTGNFHEARTIWGEFRKQFRYSERYPEALLNDGKCLFALREYDEAIRILERLEKRSYDRAILSEASFLKAKCLREKTEFEAAEKLFQKVVTESDQPQRKQEAFIWGEYCGQAWRWQLPHELVNLRLWFPEATHAPEPVPLPEAVGLQPRADKIAFEALPPRLPAALLRVPPPLPIPVERAKPVEVAEEELRKKRAATRHRALSLLEKARQAAEAGDLAAARKGYQDAIASYRAVGLEPEPDIWGEVEFFNRRVAECVETRRQRIEGLDGHEFEVQVARLYQAMGYNVRVTARNGGIDVWAFKEKQKVVIQCKHWKNPVGPGEIREFNGSQGRKVADEAVFVTSSTFTEQAEIEAEQAGIKLIDGVKLIELFSEFYAATA